MHDVDTVLGALPVAVYLTDREGRITFYNEAAAAMWGQSPELGTRWCGTWRLYWPDGRPMAHDECPMAVTLREGRPVRGVEAILEQPGGQRVPFMPYPTPLRDASGQIAGAVNLMMDLTPRYAAESDSARLAAIVASSDDAIISKTLEGRITSWNAAATRIFGFEADEMIGQPIIRIIPPELHAEEDEILARLGRGERIDHYETVRVAKDARRVEVSLTVSPVCDHTGNVVGASKVSRDITARREAEKLQRLLIEELTHRVKNTLAMIRSIASQSLARAKSAADFVSGFSGRIQALALAHDLLTQSKLQGAELADLVREQVVLGPGDDRRIALSGPQLTLDAQTAVHLALVLHELGTNARKYGALSVPGGRLSVTWELHTNGGRNLVLEWIEQGGPRVNAPRERGFGTTLIEQTLRAYGGEAAMRFSSGGVTGHIRLPLPEQSLPDLAILGTAPLVGDDVTHPSDRRSRLRGKRIAVVEDEPLVSMELESCLEAAGCEIVGPAGRLDTARSLVADGGFDAALIDANLAGERVDELAAVLARKGVPFAFVSGYGREALPDGFREAVLLSKPFTQDRLLAVVEGLVGEKGE
jgi:PAS domain S-box-containing protein